MKQGDETKVTVRDLAAVTGLSIATVSRVLNDRANVAPGTRDRVLRAMGDLGERAPRRRGTRTQAAGVFVRCPYVLTDYFGLIVSAVAEALEPHGLHVILNAGTVAQQARVLPTLPARRDVAGAVLILPPEPGAELVRLRDRGFPFVLVDPRISPPRDVAAVSAAHFAGARALTAHLIELGHRRIGIVGGPRDWLASDNRFHGYLAPLADAGVLPDPGLFRFVAEPTTGLGHRAAAELLDLPDRPTALLAFNDKMAIGALRAAAERGLRVPHDLSVAGFDDIDLGSACDPMLTTVRQPLGEMGRMAVHLLLRMLGGHRLDALHLELATELVVRDSTGPVKTV